LNDFCQNEKREFDERFRMLLNQMKFENKSIVYLSTEICTTDLRRTMMEDKGFNFFDIDVGAVSLR
jgi:hypothetical protein